MIKLTEADRARIFDYIAPEPEVNLFIFGDIENFGVDGGPVEVFASADGDAWNCILLKFYDLYILYSQREDYPVEEVAAFLHGKEVECLSGKTNLVRRLAPFFPDKRATSTYMSRLTRLTAGFLRPLPDGAELKRLPPEFSGDVAKLLSGIEEFADSYRGENAVERGAGRIRDSLEHGGMQFGVYVGDRLVSTANTTAANSQSAMVVAVATLPGHRGNGYASHAVAKLCAENFAEGKRFLCLFYDNPDAGRIYRRLGFETVGEYAMLR